MSRCYDLTYNDQRDGSSWFTKYHLAGGSDWENKHQRANIAFQIITVLALLCISIGSFTVRNKSSTARRLFIWFLAAVSFAIIGLTWSFIDAILNEECVSVQQIYLIFEIVFLCLPYVADILLLVAVSILMTSCIARTTSKVSPVHLALCGLLGIFCLVLLALQLVFNVKAVEGGGTEIYNLLSAILRIHFAFDLLYLIIVVEILIFGIVVLYSSRGDPAKSKTPKILLVVIGIFLFIRQIWATVIDGIYNFDNNTLIYEVQREEIRLARQMFYYLCTVIVYAALVASMQHLQLQAEESAVTEDVHQAIAEPIPYLPVPPEPSRKRDSFRDHSQDPIYIGPEVRDVRKPVSSKPSNTHQSTQKVQ
ncbi:MAG: hypothetical protein LQ343_003629 [Gyalolechia ehrenbergii]|nr:MAG: hypothetical protein LQ343_003629 [Gyalolechia ehrenbergii]